MIHYIGDMIGSQGVQTQDHRGRWVRAVPLPFPGGLVARVGAAWAIIRGKAYAVRWPEAGDLEIILEGRDGVGK